MKRTLNPLAATFAAALALAACNGAASAEDPRSQTARLDSQTVLSISMEGADSSWNPRASETGAGPVERVLQAADGRTLFAYGIDAARAEDGTYRLTLKPAASGPTFRASRVVSVKPGQDSIRVDLMARPQTGEKIVDVFQLRNEPEPTLHEAIIGHLLRVHNRFYHWVHGD
ncbi:MAG: hypothetical protein KGN84_06260 [Acidobacteriota bacterium]|nr:hypothetical protein [Acidobacteriota bacterium]